MISHSKKALSDEEKVKLQAVSSASSSSAPADDLSKYEDILGMPDLDGDDMLLETEIDEANAVMEINLLRQKSEQAAKIADQSELMLKYRESVDVFMEKSVATAALEESERRTRERIRKLDSHSADYKKQVK